MLECDFSIITAQFMYKLDGKYVGLLTCSVRNEYVAGCDGENVGYLDGIYALDECRYKKLEQCF